MSIWLFYNHVVISAYRKERVEQVQTTIAAHPLQLGGTKRFFSVSVISFADWYSDPVKNQVQAEV